jgi:hypothetical protein
MNAAVIAATSSAVVFGGSSGSSQIDHAPVSPVAAFTVARVLALAVPNRWGAATRCAGARILRLCPQGTLTPLLRRKTLIGKRVRGAPNLRPEPEAFNPATGHGHWSRDI